jgi:hypothetical protein
VIAERYNTFIKCEKNVIDSFYTAQPLM